MLEAEIVLLRPSSKIPTLGSADAACYDLYADIDEKISIAPGTNYLVPTGVKITPPEGFRCKIEARSGNAHKRGLRPSNCVGECDWDYTGEYMVSLYNDSNEWQIIYPGDRIAQLSFERYYHVNFKQVDELAPTKRGEGGFNSTGR